MNELEEITEGKNLEQLQKELQFQLDNGETPGGTIVSFIQAAIAKIKTQQTVN